jgi:hypothetical protein
LTTNIEIANRYGMMADDFLLTILLLKNFDYCNTGLPFIHAHVLELSAKAALYTLDPNALSDNVGHNIRYIYSRLSQLIEGFPELLPSERSFQSYNDLWWNGDGPHTVEKIPPPDELCEWELCYFIDNIVDLKYGYKKNHKLISALDIATKNLNHKFMAIFGACRKQYANIKMNAAALQKGAIMFGSTDENMRYLNKIFGDTKKA